MFSYFCSCRDFNEWLSQETSDLSSPFAFLTCGDWDLKTMLPDQCKTANVDLPDHFDRWINVKRSCHETVGTFPRGMHRLLQYTGTAPFQGRQHSGIDDCENIARVARALAAKGHIFQINCSRTAKR